MRSVAGHYQTDVNRTPLLVAVSAPLRHHQSPTPTLPRLSAVFHPSFSTSIHHEGYSEHLHPSRAPFPSSQRPYHRLSQHRNSNRAPTMFAWLSLSFLAAALLSSVAAQDIVYDSIHNATVITGTWSSGSKNVVTGSVRRPSIFGPQMPFARFPTTASLLTSPFTQGFANPANLSFTYPATSGVSYSLYDYFVF